MSSFMTTMNISLPDALKAFVDQQVNVRGYGTCSEYVRELIRKDQDIQHLREMLLDGAGSEATAPVDAVYFQDLRDRVTQRTGS
jgi:antitoxin ParD1/3/4